MLKLVNQRQKVFDTVWRQATPMEALHHSALLLIASLSTQTAGRSSLSATRVTFWHPNRAVFDFVW